MNLNLWGTARYTGFKIQAHLATLFQSLCHSFFHFNRFLGYKKFEPLPSQRSVWTLERSALQPPLYHLLWYKAKISYIPTTAPKTTSFIWCPEAWSVTSIWLRHSLARPKKTGMPKSANPQTVLLRCITLQAVAIFSSLALTKYVQWLRNVIIQPQAGSSVCKLLWGIHCFSITLNSQQTQSLTFLGFKYQYTPYLNQFTFVCSRSKHLLIHVMQY